MEFTEDFKKIIKDEFDKEDWKELQENLSSLSMAWDERWEDFEFPQFFQEMWEFVDDLLGDLPPRIIEK